MSKAPSIVTLPAVQRHGDTLQTYNLEIGIDTEGTINKHSNNKTTLLRPVEKGGYSISDTCFKELLQLSRLNHAFTIRSSSRTFSSSISCSMEDSILLSLSSIWLIWSLVLCTEDWDWLIRSPTAQSANRPSKK